MNIVHLQGRSFDGSRKRNAPILSFHISGPPHQMGGESTGKRATRETECDQGSNSQGVYWICNGPYCLYIKSLSH